MSPAPRTLVARLAAASVVATLLTLPLTLSAPARAAYERPVPEVPIQPCSVYAGPAGNDANPGTKAQPVRNVSALTAKLAPGQTGCILDGTTVVQQGTAQDWSITHMTGGSPGLPKIIRPETPGARATLATTTPFYVGGNQGDLILKDLDLVKSGSIGSQAFRIDGDRVTLDGIDLTYPENICLDVGGDARAKEWHLTAEDFVLIDSRIHDCGVTHLNDPNDPGGSHGLYLSLNRDGADADPWGAIVHNSLFDHNKDRGIQLYSDADDVLVDHVVMYANGSNLNIGSDIDHAGDPDASRSDRARVRNSIIGNSRLDAYGGENPNSTATADVLGNFALGVGAGADNVVSDSCLYNQLRNDHLFEVTDNDLTALRLERMTLDQPAQFVDVAARDFRLAPGSPCQGMGLADASRLPGGQSGDVGSALSLVDAATDNYKTWKDGASRPGVGTENQTSLLFGGVRVGDTTYVVPTAQVQAIGSTGGAAQALAQGIPLATGPDQPVSAYLSFAQPPGAGTATAYYRVFSQGAFGIYTAVNRATFVQSPLLFTLALRDPQGGTIASVPLTYRHDAQVAALPTEYLEHGGAGGRWHVDGMPTPLNWPESIAVSRTPSGAHSSQVHVPASTATTVYATPVDITGLPVPRFRMWDGVTVPQVEVFKGITSQGFTSGSATSRPFSVNQPVGSYAYSVTALCDGFCRVDYVTNTLQRSFTLEAGTTTPPSAPLDVTATAGDGQATVAWSPPSDLGGAAIIDYTVTAHRTGDAQAASRSCTTDGHTCTVTGLFNLPEAAEPYTFTVVARNGVGTGPASVPSNPVRPTMTVTAVHRPDAAVLTPGGAVGSGIVNDTGEGQVVDVSVPVGASVATDIVVTNAGSTTDSWGLAEARSGAHAALGRTWLHGTTDVTRQMSPEVGWYVVPDVAPGASRTVRLRVSAPAGTAPGQVATYALHAYHSPASDGIKDVVQVRVTVVPAEAAPAITRLRYRGKLVVGRLLRAVVATSGTPGTLRYQWLRGTRPIKRATRATYRLTRKDRGKRITLRVTLRAPGHAAVTRTYRARGRVR